MSVVQEINLVESAVPEQLRVPGLLKVVLARTGRCCTSTAVLALEL